MKNTYSQYYLFFALCLSSFCAQAQGLKGISFEPIFHIGKIVKHSDELNYTIDRLSYGATLNVKMQTFGKRDWHELHRYPLLGVDFVYYNLGKKEVFGDAYAVLPNITVTMFDRPKIHSYFQIGWGVAYLTQQFDKLSNTANNAIGSNWNATVALKFGLAYKVNPNWLVQTGLSFSHFSNGGAQLPNLGINIPALMLGVRYTPQPLQKVDYILHQTAKKANKKWGLSTHLGLAFLEVKPAGGPQYPLYLASIASLYHFNKTNRVLVGLEYEYNKAIYAFGKAVFQFNSDKEAFWGASRLSLFGAHEFLFGDWSIYLQGGAYLGNFSYLKLYPIHFKIATRYYFPSIGKSQGRFFVGLYLKSHLFRAEYIALGAGCAF